MSVGRQSGKACRNETANGLNGSPTTFERSILRLKPLSLNSSRPLPWSEAESEVIRPSRLQVYSVFGILSFLLLTTSTRLNYSRNNNRWRLDDGEQTCRLRRSRYGSDR